MTPTMQCPQCAKRLTGPAARSARFCPRCGIPVSPAWATAARQPAKPRFWRPPVTPPPVIQPPPAAWHGQHARMDAPPPHRPPVAMPRPPARKSGGRGPAVALLVVVGLIVLVYASRHASRPPAIRPTTYDGSTAEWTGVAPVPQDALPDGFQGGGTRTLTGPPSLPDVPHVQRRHTDPPEIIVTTPGLPPAPPAGRYQGGYQGGRQTQYGQRTPGAPPLGPRVNNPYERYLPQPNGSPNPTRIGPATPAAPTNGR